MGGVFDRADLMVCLDIPRDEPEKFMRLVSKLVEMKVIYRFCRGIYVRKECSLEILSRKIDPDSYISLFTVLARTCIIAQVPDRYLVAVSPKPRPRIFSGNFGTVRFVTMDSNMFGFGIKTDGGVRIADNERAFIDTLYYYKKGMKLNFNPYCDMNVDLLDLEKLMEYLENYKNLNFTGFVRSVINENRKV
ncbi:MAG TPA: hypothetical protein DCZ94_17450 [Lentisphaeria bacterium]|nr:MAG: hypothetical protein A2X48_13360 [Lentisphaerae bacterium GWF2_49_21]HBC88730.1 hypothetical protein [Lentisphaeria bacterium]